MSSPPENSSEYHNRHADVTLIIKTDHSGDNKGKMLGTPFHKQEFEVILQPIFPSFPAVVVLFPVVEHLASSRQVILIISLY